MKNLSKLVLAIFSIIILVLGVIINLIVVGWLDYEVAFSMFRKLLTNEPQNKIILISTEISMILAIICIFCDSSNKKESKARRDVLMQNDNGKLMISRETIENLVNSVVKEFQGAQEAHTRIALDAQNNVAVLVDLTVSKNVVIKELTVNMQNRIKEAIKNTSDLEVNEVNVRIKNITSSELEG